MEKNVKHLLLRKTDVLETLIFLEKSKTLKSKKVQRIFGKTFILTLSSSADFRLQKYVSDFF